LKAPWVWARWGRDHSGFLGQGLFADEPAALKKVAVGLAPASAIAKRADSGAQKYNQSMDRQIEELLKEALTLPPEARAALADSLLDSLDYEVDEAAEAVWQREIARRVQELDSGVKLPIPWTEVRSRLKAALDNGR